MFDRIEAGTFIIAAALIGERVIISGIEPKILKKE
jgi:UDP-N-acetylglucosamine enolpyruvyl transferase